MDKNEHLLRHKHSFISNVIAARDESVPSAGGQLNSNSSFGPAWSRSQSEVPHGSQRTSSNTLLSLLAMRS